MSVTLTPQQDQAVLGFRDWFAQVGGPGMEHQYGPFYSQQGYAGTGKSTVLPKFVESCGLKPEEVTFVAPTGKAAKVMTKKLREMGINKTAITIHKAMYRPKGLKHHAVQAQIDQVTKELEGATPAEARALQKTIQLLRRDLERAYDDTAPSFSLEPTSPAMREARLIVCDEASMVGARMAEDMMYFGTPILAIGDPGQLQPVGDTPGFFHRPGDHILTEIHRQALENPIIWASMLVREGKELPYGSHGEGQLRVLRAHEDDVTYNPERDVQIIVGTNGKRHRMTRKLRKLGGLDARGPAIDEMMIVTKNSRKYPSLVNGTMIRVTCDTPDLVNGAVTCPVKCIDEDGFAYALEVIQGILEENYLGAKVWTASKGSVVRAMESDRTHQIDWAYAITCHKSQGSQWNDVCVHDESGCFRDQAGPWLYTAVTRAAETLTVIS